MNPEYPYIAPTPNPTLRPNKRPARRYILVILAAGLVMGGGFVWYKIASAPPLGQLSIQYTPYDLTGVSLTLNGQHQQPHISPAQYSLKPGSYVLKISAPGYKDFSATVPITRDQTVVVNAQLASSSPSTVSSSSDIVSLPDELKSVQIIDTQYFYNSSWAILHVNTDSDSNAVLILQRSQATGKWDTVSGPGLGFGPEDITRLPLLIQQYLNNNDYVVSGD